MRTIWRATRKGLPQVFGLKPQVAEPSMGLFVLPVSVGFITVRGRR